MDKSDKLFLAAIALSILAVISITAYSFLYLKNYDFVTEAECNPETETCFYRDCSEEDACPPNSLESYRVFTTSALDFKTCLTNSCLRKCINGEIQCEEQICGESEEDVCSEQPSEFIAPDVIENESTETVAE